MTEKEFVKKISLGIGISQKKTKDILRYIFDEISEEIREGGNVKIKNFGRFDTVYIQEKRGVNPYTLEQIKIKDLFRVKFIPSVTLKSKLN